MAEQIKKFVGGIKFPGIFQKTGQSPLDDRLVVNTYADLINPLTWRVDENVSGDKTSYWGMVVSVLDEDAVYMLINADGVVDPDPTKEKNWKKIGTDANITVVTIVQASTDSKFYKLEDCTKNADGTYTPKEGAVAIENAEVTEAGTYIRTGEEGNYSYSEIQIDLSEYAKADSVVSAIDISTNSSFITVAPLDSSKGNVKLSVDLTFADVSTATEDNDGIARAHDIQLYIASQLAAVGHLKYKVVEELPTEDIDTNTIYLKKKEDSAQKEGDIYQEWMYINSKWELLGDTYINLSDYATIANVNASLSALDTSLRNYIDTSVVPDLHTYIDDAVADLSTYIDDVSSRVDDVESDINNINTTITTIESSLEDIDLSIGRIDSSLSSLDASVQALADLLENGVVSSVVGVDTSYVTMSPKTSTSGEVSISAELTVKEHVDDIDESSQVASTALVTDAYVEERLSWIEIDE